MEITIPNQDNSIMEEIPLILGDYTIFAGENNSGKTNLIKGIKKELENFDLHIIYIPAEKVIAEKEIDTNTQQDFLRTAIIELINVNFDSKSIADPPSETYFLEIYDETNRKKGFDSAHYKQFDDLMFNSYFNTKGLTQNCFDDDNKPVTPMTRLRHNIAHGKNNNLPMTLKEATENIIDFIENNK